MAFTGRELDIMVVLWEHGASTVAEVRARLSDTISHNTVASMLTILENKGHVSHTEEGRAFRYQPLVDRAQAGRTVFTRFVDTMFGGSPEALVTHFVKDRRMSRTELERIRAVLDEQIERTAKKPSAKRSKR